jgi:hypothetical protein
VTLVLLALLTAVLLAVAFGGRPSTFKRPPVRRLGLLGMALVALFTSSLAKSPGISVAWITVAALALIWFAALNRGRPGLGLAVLGLCLNAIVMILNGGMPVSADAIERAGVPPHRNPVNTEAWTQSRPWSDPLRIELTDHTVLPWLGEVVPLALPVRPAVASVGDVLVAAGAGLFVFTGLTGFGRTVPERILTVQERKLMRQERKAAKDAPSEVPTGAPPLADDSMPGGDDDLRVAAAAARNPTARDSSGRGESAASGEHTSEAPPAGSAAAASAADAKAKRKKQKRQMKKRKKKERKRLAASADKAESEEAPDVRTDGATSRPTVAATVLGPRDTLTPSEPASVGAERPAS